MKRNLRRRGRLTEEEALERAIELSLLDDAQRHPNEIVTIDDEDERRSDVNNENDTSISLLVSNSSLSSSSSSSINLTSSSSGEGKRGYEIVTIDDEDERRSDVNNENDVNNEMFSNFQ